jgi:hypothetical protein
MGASASRRISSGLKYLVSQVRLRPCLQVRGSLKLKDPYRVSRRIWVAYNRIASGAFSVVVFIEYLDTPLMGKCHRSPGTEIILFCETKLEAKKLKYVQLPPTKFYGTFMA